MRHAPPRLPPRTALRCASLLGTLLLLGSLGLASAVAAPAAAVVNDGRPSPSTGALGASPTDPADQPEAEPPAERPTVRPTEQPPQGATEQPTQGATEQPTETPQPSVTADPSESASPSPSPEPTDSADSTGPTPGPTPTVSGQGQPAETPPVPPTSSEPTHQAVRPSMPTRPSRDEPSTAMPATGPSTVSTPSDRGGESGQGWSSAAGGGQYVAHGPRAMGQAGQRDARTGFRIDPASGFAIHPRTGLLIDPATGRMLTRGTLEPCDFAYDFTTGGIRLVTSDPNDAGAGTRPAAPSPAAPSPPAGIPVQDKATPRDGATGDNPRGGRADALPTAHVGMSPSLMGIVLGALVFLGGLWYFFVFVRTPRQRPRQRD